MEIMGELRVPMNDKEEAEMSTTDGNYAQSESSERNYRETKTPEILTWPRLINIHFFNISFQIHLSIMSYPLFLGIYLDLFCTKYFKFW